MKYILLLLFAIFSLHTSAQTHRGVTASPRNADKKVVVDSVLYSVTYRAHISTDTTEVGYYKDHQRLELGRKYNRFYSLFAEDMDSVKWAIEHRPSAVRSYNGAYQPWQNLGSDEYGVYEDIFLDISKMEFSVFNRYYNTTYLYQEARPNFSWTLKGGQDTILGYRCSIAETEFRGRRYRVWYTLEIPYSYGPWKFGGLPGLILRAEDAEQQFYWEAIGLSSQDGRKMYRYDEHAKEVKREKILELNDLRWIDKALLTQTHGIQAHSITIDGAGNITEIENKKHEDYIPQLELE